MWAGFAESYGVVVHRIETDWEQSVNPAAVDAFLAEHPRVKAVTMTYADSSTGVANDVAAVARIANERGVLTLVDGVSSIGGMPFDFDAWGVDVAVTASQKCLMSSPGLAFVAMSDRAWHASESARLPRNYWSFSAIRSEISKAKPETPGTTPVHLMLQVAEALRAIHEEQIRQRAHPPSRDGRADACGRERARAVAAVSPALAPCIDTDRDHSAGRHRARRHSWRASRRAAFSPRRDSGRIKRQHFASATWATSA